MIDIPRALRGSSAAVLALACGIARADETPLVCSADRPVASRGESVQLQAWTDAGDIAWQVSAGTLVGTGTERVWRLPDRTGRVIAGASRGAGTPACSLTVFVTGESRAPGGRETGSLFLVQGQSEPAGYGLYSYFLLGARPDAGSRERFVKAIDAFLTMTPSLVDLESLFDRAELNANQMPVDASAPAKPTAEWVLEHYDYARARAILNRIDSNMRRGPYLLSVMQPPGARGTGSTIAGPMLLQDLSTVPARMTGDWYRLFLNQAAQEHFWESAKLETVGTRMRTIVAVMAIGVPDVQGAVRQWVSWGK